MMYAVRNITNSYDVIEYDFLEVAEKLKGKMGSDIHPVMYLLHMHEDNHTLSEYWPDPMEFKYTPKGKKQNNDVSILEGLIVFSDKAHDALKPLLSEYGEFLKIDVEGDKKYLFNPLIFGEEDVTLSKKRYFENVHTGYECITFNKDDVDGKVFYKSKLAVTRLYCNEAFVEAFKGHQLKGLTFTPIEDYIDRSEF
ncbi:hypothetical protein MSP8887_02634 [Marinomonas spartinae]|uniref:hypothetical protein n=1 Tax=Marinomonas spartinae TaxID=1792290 RepID=UPI000808D525|nr:hypothetical protein [Marinomonas spartinae]SBS36567.1 hypothetical protein MSP8887_02634 [Marinomonas spartinae]